MTRAAKREVAVRYGMDPDKCWHASCEVGGRVNPACLCACHEADRLRAVLRAERDCYKAALEEIEHVTHYEGVGYSAACNNIAVKALAPRTEEKK